jgi:hypothetical protein
MRPSKPGVDLQEVIEMGAAIIVQLKLAFMAFGESTAIHSR